MTLTAHMIGTYLIIDANTIHKKRPSTILGLFVSYLTLRQCLWLLKITVDMILLSLMNSTYDISDAVKIILFYIFAHFTGNT